MGCTVSRSSVSAEKYLRERKTACSLARARNADLTIRRYAQEWILTLTVQGDLSPRSFRGKRQSGQISQVLSQLSEGRIVSSLGLTRGFSVVRPRL